MRAHVLFKREKFLSFPFREMLHAAPVGKLAARDDRIAEHHRVGLFKIQRLPVHADARRQMAACGESAHDHWLVRAQLLHGFNRFAQLLKGLRAKALALVVVIAGIVQNSGVPAVCLERTRNRHILTRRKPAVSAAGTDDDRPLAVFLRLRQDNLRAGPQSKRLSIILPYRNQAKFSV